MERALEIKEPSKVQGPGIFPFRVVLRLDAKSVQTLWKILHKQKETFSVRFPVTVPTISRGQLRTQTVLALAYGGE